MQCAHRFSALIILLVLIFTSWACATTRHTTGEPIDESKVEQIETGSTTLNDIISMFGAPQDQSSIGDKTLYIYQYCEVRSRGTSIGYISTERTSESCDELTITFDNEGVVEAHNYQKGT